MIATNVELESLRTFSAGRLAQPGIPATTGFMGLGMDVFSYPAAPSTNEKQFHSCTTRGCQGTSSIDENGTVNRQMLWARFRKGRPTLLDQQTHVSRTIQ